MLKAQDNDWNMDAAQLYREEIITDLRLGTIRKLIPIHADGREDETRKVRFVGQAQVMTPAGALPISFDLEGETLEQAIAQFGPAARQALEETVRELEEMRRKAASNIVVPGAEDISRLGGDSPLIKP